jgi:hypothetical protein
MDDEFESLLKDRWRGHYDKTNKISTLVVTYATVFAAVDDPTFAKKLQQCEQISNRVFLQDAAEQVAVGDRRPLADRLVKPEVYGEITYELSAKYVNMGWKFAQTLFNQSIDSYEELDKYPIVTMARKVLSHIANMYAKGTIVEGFPECAAFNNALPVDVRPHMSEILSLLTERGWLTTTMRTQVQGKGRLNNGFPNKIVKPGDIIYHLNIGGLIVAKKEYSKSEEHWGQPDIDLLKSVPVGGTDV